MQDYKTECDVCGQEKYDGLYYTLVTQIGEHTVCDDCIQDMEIEE